MTRAFPEGLDAARSLRVAKALEPYMSDRSLATMLAWVVDGDPVCYPRYMNTIYSSCQLPADDPDLQDVLIRLKSAGLQAWIAEESPEPPTLPTFTGDCAASSTNDAPGGMSSERVFTLGR